VKRDFHLVPLCIGAALLQAPGRALAAPSVSAAPTRNATATTNIYQPLGLLNKDDLNFGMATVTTGGTVVLDPNTDTVSVTGGVVPAASVSVRNTNTNTERMLVTNGDGIYVAPFMQPGSYSITASKAGFGKIVRTDLTLQVGQILTVDIPLPLQTTTETVTVIGTPSLVDTEKTDMSQVVSQSQKDNLPNAGRRWENFALLTPNVTTDGGTGSPSAADAATAAGAATVGTSSAGGGGSSTGARAGGSSATEVPGPHRGRRGETRNSRAGDLKSDKGAGGPSSASGNGAPATIIPDGNDDDIVARRLRKAAEVETDPELKEKLWKEYVEYKKNTQVR